MSIVKIPTGARALRFPQIADTLSEKRFELIKSNLHFANNQNNTGTDKLFKIRPLYEDFKKKINSVPKSKRLSVDEQIIPFKGKSALKGYNLKKPKKWGYKMFVCFGVNGIIHDIEFYTGKIEPCLNQLDIGASGNIVLRLIQDFPRHFIVAAR
ncbi:piggyBac transposable element-derived protein 3 [Biomphalaria glabrata]|uniref:PiggyBac transposable element-derived protein domain-containing protein n=1 Tax=Biomphalaria glabrata TaxID=6526 RepID=A0A2C9KX52_BIOGL|nr:piggyBac transposable element-derived protein 3-like [Biomphalaria glabrata]